MFRLISLLFALLLVGCASDGSAVQKNAAGEPVPDKIGTVEAIKPIDLPTEQRGSGYFLGGTLGNIGGAVLGGGRGAVAASVLGGSVGATAGDSAQNSNVRPGLEIWIKLENGQSAVVTQPARNQEPFKVGERVRIVHTLRGQRVEHESFSH